MRSTVLALAFVSVAVPASGQPRALPLQARAGDVLVQAVEQQCHTRVHSCERATRRVEVGIHPGAAPARVRVLRLERREGARWIPMRLMQLQVEVEEPLAARATITIPPGDAQTLGLLHGHELPLPMAGVRYRVRLEVNGERVVVHPSEHPVIEHPRRRR